MTSHRKRRVRTAITAGLVAGGLALVGWAGLDLIPLWTSVDDGGVGNDYRRDAAIDNEGSVIAVGYTEENVGQDGYIVKRLADKTFAWDVVVDNPTTVGSTSLSTEQLYSVAVDSQDDIYVCGTISGTWPAPEGYHQTALLQKYTADGVMAWQWRGTSAYGPWSTMYGVAVDGSDNVYVTGSVFGNWGGEENKWALWKFDPQGNLQSGFPVFHNVSSSNALPDHSYAIAVDDDGGIVTAGIVGVSGSSPNRNLDAHIRRYLPDGTLDWSDTYSGPANRFDYAYGVTIDAAGDVYLAGYTNVGADNGANLDWDGLVIKYAQGGGRLWTQTYQTGAGWDDVFYDVFMGADGNPVVCGFHKPLGDDARDARMLSLRASDGSVLDEQTVELNDYLAFVRGARRGGTHAFAGWTKDGGEFDQYTGVFRSPNTAPTIDEAPQADVDLAAMHEGVGFDVTVSDADQDPLTVTWEFGDGEVGAGTTTMHAYSAPGTYTVEVSVTDGQLSVGDTFELTVGEVLADPSVKSKLNFKKPGKDWLVLKCGVDLGTEFDPDGKTVELDVDGVPRTFVLSAKGKAKVDKDVAKLKYKKKKGYWLLTVNLKKSDFSSAWADDGLLDETVKKAPRTLKVAVLVGGVKCAHLVDVLYTAKQGKWGKLK